MKITRTATNQALYAKNPDASAPKSAAPSAKAGTGRQFLDMAYDEVTGVVRELDDNDPMKAFYERAESEINRYKTLAAELNTSRNTANKKMSEDLAESRRIMLNGYRQRIQLLSPSDYTAKSWRACLDSYKKALIIGGMKNATPEQLQKALTLMRTALAALKRREKEEDGFGTDAERDNAEHEANFRARAINEGAANAEEVNAMLAASGITAGGNTMGASAAAAEAAAAPAE